jgi:hypothetical protein
LLLKITTDVSKKNFSEKVKYFSWLESRFSNVRVWCVPLQGWTVVNQADRKLRLGPRGLHPARLRPLACARSARFGAQTIFGASEVYSRNIVMKNGWAIFALIVENVVTIQENRRVG